MSMLIPSVKSTGRWAGTTVVHTLHTHTAHTYYTLHTLTPTLIHIHTQTYTRLSTHAHTHTLTHQHWERMEGALLLDHMTLGVCVKPLKSPLSPRGGWPI